MNLDFAPPRRKRIRLPAGAYLEHGSAWFVTIGTANRGSVFVDHHLAGAVVAAMRECCAARRAILDAYCLMPDHAHLILQVVGAGLVDVIGDIKSRTTRVWWHHGGAGSLWQRSFHDRGLRTPDDHQRALAYLVDNPVRAGLVLDWWDYPYVGGALLDDPVRSDDDESQEDASPPS